VVLVIRYFRLWFKYMQIGRNTMIKKLLSEMSPTMGLLRPC